MTTHKTGTTVQVTQYAWDLSPKTEAATVLRVSKAMQPMPAGYLPVRFVADGAVLLVHESRIAA